MVTLANYDGREQAYVKHLLLESYIERLAHKVASKFDHVVYVDGFAGPWLSADQKFGDTSFGIALGSLRRAKSTWKDLNRDVSMSAFLVEKNSAAYRDLETVPKRFPDIDVRTYRGDFIELMPRILSEIPSNAFVFFFIDPKGWKIPLEKLKPLLERENSEVIFNFMFDFINRAASIEDPAVRDGLNELMPHGEWRKIFDAAKHEIKNSLDADGRKRILVEAFSTNLKHFGNFKYVVETTVQKPTLDRPFYCLFYATRSATGIDVFRSSQIAALEGQSALRASSKIQRTESASGQREMFLSLDEMAPSEMSALLKSESDAAELRILEIVKANTDILYEDLWPIVLSRNLIRRKDVNSIAARLRAEGKLAFPDWEPRKRVPQPHYRVRLKDA